MADPKKKTPERDPAASDEWDKGYRGEVPDDTPNEAYTISGVTSGQRRRRRPSPTASTRRADQG